MKAAVLYDRYRIIVKEVDKPKIRQYDEVLIKVHFAGLSGADLHLFVGNIKSSYPIIPGYCFSGFVEETGSETVNFQVGDRVCGLNFGFFGAFSEYIVVSQDRIFKIPDNVSFEEAAYIEPVALAIKSTLLTKPLKEENVLILGQGFLGFIHTQLFKKFGTTVFVTDLIQQRLNLSKKIGADYTFNPKKCDVFKEISDMTEKGIDIVVEATGNPSIVELLQKIMKKGVRIVLFSIWNPAIKQFKHLKKEISIYKISGANKEDCLTALKMISDRKVDLKPIINRKISLKRIEEAYNLALNQSQGKYIPKTLGVIINIQDVS